MKDRHSVGLDPNLVDHPAVTDISPVEAHKGAQIGHVLKGPSRGHLSLIPLIQIENGQVDPATPLHGKVAQTGARNGSRAVVVGRGGRKTLTGEQFDALARLFRTLRGLQEHAGM